MFKSLAAFIFLAGLVGSSFTAQAQTTGTAESIYSIPVEPMKADGGTSATTLETYKGKVLLIVNVASKCGFTKQYDGLQDLHEKYKDRGFTVLGFPSNDFKGQEPGTEQEIVEFCRATYGVNFPLFAKIHVTGDQKAPLYKFLTEGNHAGKGEVSWNFNKYLVDKDGKVVAHYVSKVAPDDPQLVSKIEELLAK